jgi:hypothetical protein
VELHQLDFSLAVRGPQHRELHRDLVERHDAVYPAAPNLAVASRLESELDEELGCGGEVVNNDSDVFHSLDCHALDRRISAPSSSQFSSCDGVKAGCFSSLALGSEGQWAASPDPGGFYRLKPVPARVRRPTARSCGEASGLAAT